MWIQFDAAPVDPARHSVGAALLPTGVWLMTTAGASYLFIIGTPAWVPSVQAQVNLLGCGGTEQAGDPPEVSTERPAADVRRSVRLTQTQYDALDPPQSGTHYVIVEEGCT